MAAALQPLQECLRALKSLERGETSAQDLVAATGRATAELKAKVALNAAELRELLGAAGDIYNHSIELAADPANARSSAQVRQCASDLLELAPASSPMPREEQLSVANMLYQTGRSWAALGEFEAADAAYAQGLERGQALQDACCAAPSWGPFEQECGATYFGLLCDRLEAARQLRQQMLVSALLAQAKGFACDPRTPAHEAAGYRLALAAQLKGMGLALAQAGKPEPASALLHTAYELLESLEDEGELLEPVQAEVQGFVCQVLTLLAHSLCAAGDTDKALNCIEALRTLEPQQASSYTLPFLAHQAYLRLGRFAEAETELWSIVSHEDAQPEVCLAAITAALAYPEGLQSVRAALPTALERFAEDSTTLILGLARALTSQSSTGTAAAGPGPGDAPEASGSSGCSEELERLVLELVADDRLLEGLREEPEQRAKLHTLLWSHAARLMGAQLFERACRFYGASLAVAEGAELRADALRAQALCASSMRSFDRAQEYVAAAEEAQPRCLRTAFLRLKVCLAAKDSAGAAAAVPQLMECEGATPDLLRTACIEALDAGDRGTAKQALLLLLERAAAAPPIAEGSGAGEGGGASGAAGAGAGYEATIFQNLIRLVLDSPPAANTSDEGAGAGGSGGNAAMEVDAGSNSGQPATALGMQQQPVSHYAELAKFIDMAVRRMRAVGPAKFFALEDGKPLQLEWMALTAWSAACEAVRAAEGAADEGARVQQAQLAAVLMGASAELWAAHPRPSATTLSRQKSASLFAATSALDAFDLRPDYDPALDLARRYLASAREAAAAAAGPLPLGAAAAGGKADAFLLLMEFSLATRQGDERGQLEAVERAKALPAFTAEHFAKMAQACREGPHKNLDVCRTAELAALARLTSEPALNYPVLAATLRSLVELSRADDEKLRLLKEAQGVLAAAQRGAYPPREAAWLVTSAWNRGCLHVRYSRHAEAVRFMHAALGLLRAGHCPELEAAQQAMMEAELAATLAQGPPTPDEGPRRSGRTAAAATAGGPPRA